MEDRQTGNPVFDYRASFRAGAGQVQRALSVGGLALFAACGIAFLFGQTSERLRFAAGLTSLAGLVACGLGIAWGFYWRKSIRAEFRRQYGPPS